MVLPCSLSFSGVSLPTGKKMQIPYLAYKSWVTPLLPFSPTPSPPLSFGSTQHFQAVL